jgi:hypothetical protein
LIPGDVLIAASSLRNKADLLDRMKQHQQQMQQQQAAQAPLVQAHAEAQVKATQAKAAADGALAAERIHNIHSEFSAPPFGQPNVAPDPPSAPGTVEPQMHPVLQNAHDLADLRQKQTAAHVNQATVLHKMAQAAAAMRPPPPKANP